MPHIELKRKWFGPNGVSYEAKHGSIVLRHEVDDDVLAQAPSDATVFDDKGEKLGTAAEVREKAAKPHVAVKKE